LGFQKKHPIKSDASKARNISAPLVALISGGISK
jgi:hypothetical protein